ncbi:haloacid dehalogenase-like hydrolase [Spirillospora sp. CA-294931]|uniref:haloacid dehalogenase-like hydrolase n=1 Tax=Spirillospora sp. CA-294931 TaxID=3240042 RepID=UPI003D8BC011
MRSARTVFSMLGVALLVVVSGVFSAPGARAGLGRCGRLDASLSWHGANRVMLQRFLDDVCASGTRGRLAIFDWDNTVIKNDVGDAMVFWLLRHDKVRQPPRKDWAETSPFLTPAGVAALGAACGRAPAGRPLRTSSDAGCADEILSVYSEGKTTGGADAFGGFDHRRAEPSHAWAAQLLAGYTPGQVRGFAAAARRENLSAPRGAVQRVGSREVTGWIRYYDQMRDLLGAMRRSGLDVWVVSASPQPVVEVWAAGVGVRPNRVIGVRTVRDRGRLTSGLAGCGGDAEAIPYIDGKRCLINQEILGLAAPFERAPHHLRQVFAAGDSDTDVAFLRDATTTRLVVNRNKPEVMCRAYHGGWLVNPMFIEPKPAKAGRYPCSTTGYTTSSGASAPVVDDNGVVIPDQTDSVF